jgi:tight adherence protein B
MTQSSQAHSVKQGSKLSKVIRNGVTWTKPIVEVAFRIDILKQVGSDATDILKEKGYISTPKNLCSVFMVILLASGVVAGILGGSVVLGIIVPLCLCAAVFMVVTQAKEKRKIALREAIPDAFRSMSICSHSGFSLPQMFSQVASESSGYLKTLFLSAQNDLSTGATVTEALMRFRQGAHVSELAFIALALDIQHKTGGSLQQVLDAARDSLESEMQLQRALRVQTAQAKLSANVVSVMPFFLIAIFSFISPGFMNPFFTSPLGWVLLFVAVSMQLGGILLVRRLLKVGVE